MGSDRSIRTRLVARCCYGASFGIGFVITVLTLAAMFWIAWCYFGLTIIQLSDSQRRGVPNYSYTTVKPSPSTSSPSRSTTLATEETSVNSISKLPTTASVLRGSSRGESPVKVDKKKESTTATNLAKGDFASRDRSSHNSNAAAIGTQDTSTSLSPPHGPPKPKDEPRAIPEERASILSASSTQDSEEDRIYTRKVSPTGSENRPEEQSDPSRSNRRSPPETQPDSRLDISPTKVYDIDTISGSSRRSQEPEVERKSRDEDRVQPRDYVDRDKEVPSRREEISSSRRTNTESVYREPDFDREHPRRSSSNSDRDRTRYDETDDERGSRSRYDRIDRWRETDDRYSKGDTRVYPDDRGSRPVDEDRDRDRSRDKYPDSSTRRGDDDRYEDRSRGYDERPRHRDRDPDTRSRDRVSEERPPVRDERYRDDDRYRSRQDDKRGSDDDRYKSRDEDRYRPRDDDRYRSRDDDRYVSRDDDRYRPRDDDKYRPPDDDRYRSRDDDRQRSRDDDRYRSQDDDRYRSRVDDNYRSREDRYESRDVARKRTEDDDRRDSPSRYIDDKETPSSRADSDKYADISSSRPRDEEVRESISRSSIDTERRQSSRSGYDTRNDGMVPDYDVPLRDRSRTYSRDEIIPSRISRPSHDDERVNDRDREEDRRPYRYDDDKRTISPTRTRDDVPFSRSTLIDSRSKDKIDNRRYTDDQRDRIRDDRYNQDDRISRTRPQDSRVSPATSENSRLSLNDRGEYRTKLPSERIDDAKFTDRREEVILDHRSYGSEKDDGYRSDSRRDPVYDDQIRRPPDDSRRRYNDDDDRYTRRGSTADEEQRSRTRPNYDDDRTRSRATYDDRRYDDRYKPRNDDRSLPIPNRKYDTDPDDDEPIRRRDPEVSSMRKDDSIDRRDRLRPSASSRDEERYFFREEYPDSKSSSRRRYDDDLSASDSRNYKEDSSDDRRRSRQPVDSKDPIIGSSMTTVNSRVPSDVIIREKRYQTTEKRTQSSRVSAPDEIYEDRSYGDDEPESKSRDVQKRPLSAKDVLEAAIRHPDASDENVRKVHYPVFDPRVSNLTSPELIRPSERRGTTFTARKRRSIRSLDS